MRLVRDPSDVWGRIREKLLAAMERGLHTHTERDVLDGVLEGKFQLWVYGDSFCVTEVCQYPQMRTVRILWAGGELEDFRENIVSLRDWAKSIGCAGVEHTGRKGWSIFGGKDLGVWRYLDA